MKHVAVCVVALWVALAISTAAGPPLIVITSLSSAPDFVTGGDALVEITPGPSDYRVTLNGRDITTAFRTGRADEQIGLVTGLVVGKNTLRVEAADSAPASLTLTNYPSTGPVIFPDGVCDWFKPGLNQTGVVTWASWE